MDSEFLLIRKAHDTPKESLCEHNDEILERIYMGCRFKNDTDRLPHPKQNLNALSCQI